MKQIRYLFLLVFALVALEACAPKPKFITPCDGCVDKVQPNGTDPQRDLTYSQVNATNGQGDALSGQAALQKAQATAIVEEAVWGTRASTSYRIGAFSGAMCGFWGVLGFLFFIVLPIYLFLNSGRFEKKKSVETNSVSHYDMTMTNGKRTFNKRR